MSNIHNFGHFISLHRQHLTNQPSPHQKCAFAPFLYFCIYICISIQLCSTFRITASSSLSPQAAANNDFKIYPLSFNSKYALVPFVYCCITIKLKLYISMFNHHNSGPFILQLTIQPQNMSPHSLSSLAFTFVIVFVFCIYHCTLSCPTPRILAISSCR